MTDKKISALPPANVPLVGTELIPLVQSGTTSNVTFTNFMAYPPGPMYFPNATAIYSYDASAVAYKLMERTAGGAVFVYGYAGRRALRATDGITNIYAGDASNTSVASYTTSGMSLDVGNITPAVAAKGVNFTANTPAAGMTSQLLNWYEEGTWTPTLTPGTSGSITLNTGFNTAAYTRVGRLVTITGEIIVISVSSPVGTVINLSLPIAIGVGVERSHQVSGAISTGAFGVQTLSRYSGAGGASVIEITYAAATVAADFRVQFSISYFA